MEQLLIFGNGDAAMRAAFEAEQSGSFKVVGFASDDVKSLSALNVPVVEPLSARLRFSVADTWAFAAGDMTYLNQDRLARYMTAKRMGYRIAVVASRSSIIANGVKLRENMFIGSNVRLMPGVSLGTNTWIMQGSEIGMGARLGSSCWVSSHCDIGDRVTLGKNCTLAAGVQVCAGIALPPWSLINRAMRMEETPAGAVFIDSRFREPVVLRGSSSKPG